jgi:peptide/nickel transport system substrate-binding protein
LEKISARKILLGLPIVVGLVFLVNLLFVGARVIPPGNELIISSIGDASFLNPVLSQDSASGEINGFVFNGLLKYDRDLVLVGDLAESWEVQNGARPEIRFKLRPGVRWHDGRPFTGEDVRFTYQTIMDVKTNTVRRSDYELVERIEVPNPHEVRIVYKEPFSPGLSSWTMGIIPRHLLSGQDINKTPFNRRPVGTGPFRFVEWVSDEKIILGANPDYFEGRPRLDRIVYRIIPETSLSEIELLTGGIDLFNTYPHQVSRMRQDPRLTVYRYPSLAYTYIGYNQKNPLFQDRRVRQALTMAVNREEMITFILFGLGKQATGPFPPHLWYADPGIRPWPFDPARARRLLAEAGWQDRDGDGILDRDGRPFRFTLITNSGNEVRKDVGVLIQRYWREVGVDVKLEMYEWSVFLKNFIDPRHFEACILGWSLGVDPDAYNIWHSSQIKEGFNFIGYQHAEADRLWEEGRREYNLEKRRQIYFRLHALLAEEQPYTFLFVSDASPALRRKFKVEEKDPAGKTELAEVKPGKAGLMHDLIHWTVPKEAALTP